MQALIELHYLPCIQYFSKFRKYPGILLDDSENFKKQSYRNRCLIAGANGVMPLITPQRQGKTQLKTYEVEIDNSRRWQREHWHSIRSAYGKAPYFIYYADYFEMLYKEKFEKLFDFNLTALKICLRVLKMPESQLAFASDFKDKQQVVDLRDSIHPKEKYQKDDADFLIKPYWQVFQDRYGFQPNLSIIDLIFNTGPESVNYL